MFEETPRSKFAKKYIPPLDVLAEENSSIYTTSMRESNFMVHPQWNKSGALMGDAQSPQVSLISNRQQFEYKDLELDMINTPILPGII